MPTTSPSLGRFRRAEKVTFRRVGAETVLIRVDDGGYFSLNETGSLVWERLGEGIPAEDVLAELVREYDAPPERARADLENLLERLLKARLILPS